MAAQWIAPGLRDRRWRGLRRGGSDFGLATHLAEVIKQHAHELLTRQETKRLLDRLGESHPKLVEELVPKLISLGEVQKVLQQLLREQVSIRDLPAILESLLDTAAVNKNPVLLVEAARQALGRALVRPLLAEDGGLRVVTLDPGIEEELTRGLHPRQAASGAGAGAIVRAPGAGGPEEAGGRAGAHGHARCCSVALRRVFICAVCWSPSCPSWWCCRRERFPPVSGAVVGNDSMRRKHECRASHEQIERDPADERSGSGCCWNSCRR